MALTYQSFVDQFSNLLVIPSTDANFQTMLPGAIDYSEQRIYRELDLLATSVTDTTTVSSGIRTVDLPTNVGTYLVVETVNFITPVTALTSNGTRNQATMVTPEFIDAVYPNGIQNNDVPQFVAMLNSSAIVMGPSPDKGYMMEVRGTQRPTPLSSANTSTILTTMLPDLFFCGAAVFGFGWMRDFGGQADNPQAAQSWESQFKTLSESANVEELRKVYQSGGWTSLQPSPIATPSRV